VSFKKLEWRKILRTQEAIERDSNYIDKFGKGCTDKGLEHLCGQPPQLFLI